jgi:hypothetical protein
MSSRAGRPSPGWAAAVAALAAAFVAAQAEADREPEPEDGPPDPLSPLSAAPSPGPDGGAHWTP